MYIPVYQWNSTAHRRTFYLVWRETGTCRCGKSRTGVIAVVWSRLGTIVLVLVSTVTSIISGAGITPEGEGYLIRPVAIDQLNNSIRGL